MRLPRVRFTVRRMMVAVAIVAFILGATLLMHQRYERYMLYDNFYSGRAEEHRRSASFNTRLAEEYSALAVELREEATASEGDVNLGDSKAYAAGLKGKAEWRNREAAKDLGRADRTAERAAAFRRAAIRPWLFVSPDPTEPE